MPIGKQVSEAIAKMDAKDPEGALFAICAAIEATAKKEFGAGGRKNYKDFIHQNMDVITWTAFGPRILNLNLAYQHPEIQPSASGLCTFQDIMYHVVRCGLYHTTDLPSNLKLIPEKKIHPDNGVLCISDTIVYGLITAVVLSPTNKNEVTPVLGTVNLDGFPIPLSKLWGRKSEFEWLMEVLDEVRRLRQEAARAAQQSSGQESPTGSGA